MTMQIYMAPHALPPYFKFLDPSRKVAISRLTWSIWHDFYHACRKKVFGFSLYNIIFVGVYLREGVQNRKHFFSYQSCSKFNQNKNIIINICQFDSSTTKEIIHFIESFVSIAFL